MRIALTAVSVFVVALTLVLLPWALIAACVVVLGILLLRRTEGRAVDVLAAVWLVGGTLLALGLVELAWSDGLSGGFAGLAAVGGVVLACGFLLLPAAVRGRGSLLAIAGLVLAVLGWATAWFGGWLLLPLAVALYAAGLVRAGLVSRRVALGVAAALAASVALGWTGTADVVAAELAVLAAIGVGVALLLRGRVPQRA